MEETAVKNVTITATWQGNVTYLQESVPEDVNQDGQEWFAMIVSISN